ncbi:MAG: CHAT domain-containing protein [Coleofasciculaceae cyanobacterium SM2_1_6]|nr:CHAT domain-containing protein [Coleofasciculaceae cyanobacterium SM2_1_6]
MITNPTIPELSLRLRNLEESFQSEFQQYLGVTSQGSPPQNLQATQVILKEITETTSVRPGMVYVFFAPPGGDENFSSIDLTSQTNRVARDTDILETVVITGTGEPVRVRLPGTTRRQVVQVANNFRSEVTNFRSSRGFLNPAQQMYKWLLEPLEAELQKQGIDNLVFLMDAGLRSIPLAAMHDGKGFIVERYSVGLMPSLNLTPLDHVPLEGAQVLAMGATTFGNSGLNPLPAVPLELNNISQLWEGVEFLNETFTLNNLIQQRQNRPFRIIHLATHGVFNPGDRSNSYIQLWDGRLRLDQLDQLNWGNPPVDLLVLSACQTALGDKEAELGFAGLAINAGVRSALASLWEVNDAATLGLMTKFYQQLQVTTTKAEALRLAQLAMIRGEVRLEDGNLVTADGLLPLNEELRSLSNLNLTHPYYWSAFTMVGNPW